MILYRFVDISTNFEGFLKLARKGKILPTWPHTKNPQDVDNPVDNLGHIY